MIKGTTRVVFLVGDYAVKFPRPCKWSTFLYGLLANMLERGLWNTQRNDVLAPVVCACPLGFWLIMKRADKTCSGMDEFKNEKDIKKFISDWNNMRTDTFDDMPNNIGYFGDKLKIIDYGG